MEHHITLSMEDYELAATLHYPQDRQGSEGGRETCRWPLVVICHGFIGGRIGVDRLFVKTARELSRHGFMVLRFDYGGCGESTGHYGEGGLDRLIAETRRVIDYALDIDCVDPTRVTLLGHSLGGATAILTAAVDSRVKTLVLWSAVAHPLHDIAAVVGKRVYDQVVRDGAADYMGYRLTNAFFESLSRYKPLHEIKKFRGDVLLVHGSGDEVIPSDYCFLYQRVCWARPEGMCDKEVVLQANHTYSSGETSSRAIAKTCDWLAGLDSRKKDWNDWTI